MRCGFYRNFLHCSVNFEKATHERIFSRYMGAFVKCKFSEMNFGEGSNLQPSDYACGYVYCLKADFHLGKLSSGQERTGKFPLC